MSNNLTGATVGGNLALGKAGLTGLSGAATTFSTSAAAGASGLLYTNKGAYAILANQAGAATPTYNAATPTALPGVAASGLSFLPMVAQQAPAALPQNILYTGSACVYVFGVDSSGLVRVAQGPLVNYAGLGNPTACPFPFIPDWFTPFSYVVVTLSSATSVSWTFGTGLWNAAGVTISAPVDILDLPGNPPLTA